MNLRAIEQRIAKLEPRGTACARYLRSLSDEQLADLTARVEGGETTPLCRYSLEELEDAQAILEAEAP